MTFPTPSPADWRGLAEKALKDRPLESLVHLDADGLAIRPLYAAATGGQPVSAPRPSDADGRAWDLRTLVEGDDPAAVNAAVLADLEGGAASVLLKGAMLADSEPLARALEGVALELAAVGLDAGLDGPEAANALAVAAKGSPRAKLMFHMDPLSAFAEAGAAPRAADEHLMLAANTAARHAGAYPEATLFLAGGQVVHEAGGSIGQELGFAAANAVALIRAGVAAGMTAERALRGTVLGVSVDQEYFDGLARVRALRLIWRTISKAFGVETPAIIEARSSRRMLSARDPWPNLLRLTAAGFAGAVGGADAVVLDGLSRANGRSDAFARRQARNTQAVLMEEAHLGRVDDPAAGSWFLDARTRDLAEAGWAEFQRIEAEGGLIVALRTGDVQDRVAAARAEREAALADGHAGMVGVTKFVDPDPRPAPFEAEAKTVRQTGGDACDPLIPVRFAAPFETQAWEAAR
ncbi:MAG: methylmalonyl-CoA mutase [Alphaproteobacteria bacterium]|jgi:methylmalonyl-CoA mutase|nr:methylmalonyl-CoA mutase [Alphaproteobacteria bacterium]MBU2041826.1 methylmalonyl-CoA mutase [Alphaproteobacteria bacterium]MBU2127210.1 methylmalonyl-CoA mutase [Alphaproteobacteria bacterium]MBU2207967.1 methylmalonyl-CoA mutase [Alphaproteobacteria bacterium]MBU2289556.1 methylmalonyl-CoA mutase [Alphaproteobacteria bacterium]